MKNIFMERVHKTYVLSKNDKIIATFGNLRKLVNFMKNEDFPSYWTLIRIKVNPIELKSDYKIFKARHY
jgi:hypothetical protein